MAPLARCCLCLMLSLAHGAVMSCSGDAACSDADSSALLQSHIGLAEVTSATDTEEDGEDAVPGDDPNANPDCNNFVTQPSCQSNGCQWTSAFTGESKEDGSGGILNHDICADDEEVKEEMQDVTSNVTAEIQLRDAELQSTWEDAELENTEDDAEEESTEEDAEEQSTEKDAASESTETDAELQDKKKWCRRRRANRRRGPCPWARRRRAPPAKIETNGCPTGYTSCKTGTCKCPGSGKCCRAGWSASCNQGCAQSRCQQTGGTWIPLNYMSNPYTCAPAKVEASGCPTGFTVTTTGKCPKDGKIGTCCRASWSRTCSEACAKIKCTSTGGTWVPLDYMRNPYTCGMPKTSTSKPTAAPATSQPTSLFNSMDLDKSGKISRQEWQQALAAGKIKDLTKTGTPGATTAPPPPPTAAPTLAPTAAPTLAPTAAPTLAPTAAPTLAPTAAPTAFPTTAPTAAPGSAAAAKAVFDKIDADDNDALNRDELKNAIATGKVIETSVR